MASDGTRVSWTRARQVLTSESKGTPAAAASRAANVFAAGLDQSLVCACTAQSKGFAHQAARESRADGREARRAKQTLTCGVVPGETLRSVGGPRVHAVNCSRTSF
jgi:hypothetical protein